ncbi:hypothetical protein JTE90_010199 [Oedothorax gibbosus]|uniref:Innexin n=1 Tax=Oedothorax gibbosus TaxID=931172 RepID=A0AAV6UJ29_9ARAC|nr:hypothetical protein JTE90_010199 [Oedothorax gibbosus]
MAGVFSFLNIFKGWSPVTTTQSYSPNPRHTAVLLVIGSVIVAWRQQFNTAIDCIAGDDFPASFINDFCYIHATYSFSDSWNKSVGVDILYPGVDKYKPDAEIVYHTYYQWVSLVLFVQAIAFGVPSGLWRCMEAGKLWKLVSNSRIFATSNDAQHKQTADLVYGFMAGSRGNSRYFHYYCLASLLSLANVIFQAYLVDVFLGGGFLSYGVENIKWGWNKVGRPDPKSVVFPKMAQCDYYNYGRTGDVQRHDVMCMLPINSINDKIYLVLWFWFVWLLFACALAFLVDLSFLIAPKLRFKMLRSGLHFAEQCTVERVVERCHSGDWFLIVLLRRNLHPRKFREFLLALSDEWAQKGERETQRLSNEDRQKRFKTDEPDIKYC